LSEVVGQYLETLARACKGAVFFKNPGKCIQNNAQEETSNEQKFKASIGTYLPDGYQQPLII
jgi:hypothetical protein